MGWKFRICLAIALLLALDYSYAWQSYQNDLGNGGIVYETGYYPAKTKNFTIDQLGMNFQPLADNLDSKGSSEIVIFANNSLILLDKSLRVLNQTKIGKILGQPLLFDSDNDPFIEIVFNSAQGSGQYFFVYEYKNNQLAQEFNITLQNNASFGGIKCLDLDGTKSCVFKDKLNYINIVDLSSRIIDSRKISNSIEMQYTVPAIGDIDSDGNYEAVFWLDNNSDQQYGIASFDLTGKKTEWVIDNIYSANVPAYKLKGNPVLADLNNDGKMEIAAAVYYDDSCGYEMCDDSYTALYVFAYNGSKAFNICGNGNCNDNTAGYVHSSYEGTGPLIIDIDKDKTNEICYITHQYDFASGFIGMSLKCFNYSGYGKSATKMDIDPNSAKGPGFLADMDNDGELDIVGTKGILRLNGTPIIGYPFRNLDPIVADVDGNGALDILWSEEGQTKLIIDDNAYTPDLSVSESEIFFSKLESKVNVTVLVRNFGQKEAKRSKIFVQNKETLETSEETFDLARNGNKAFSFAMDVNKEDIMVVSVDYNNEIGESNEENNFAEKEFKGLPYVYIQNVGDYDPSAALHEIISYLKSNIDSAYITENPNDADIKIYLTKHSAITNLDRDYTLDNFGWGFEDFSAIDYLGNKHYAPYAGLMGEYNVDGQANLVIYGNRIEGDIAAAKEFVKLQSELINGEVGLAYLIDDGNVDAIGVYDYLHQPSNEQYFETNTKEFAVAVRNALNGETFTSKVLNVTTSNGVMLRMKHIIPDKSSTYMEILNYTGVPVELPVVLARGLHSNLTTWEVFGEELANDGRDTWLIEVTGGPYQDCDSCPNYEFSDLTDNYWPTLINSVLTFSGKDKVQYVSHSNACRTALESLQRGSLNVNKIDTFVGVGCPGAFNYDSPGKLAFDTFGDELIEKFSKKKPC